MKRLNNDQGRLIVNFHELEIFETYLHVIQVTNNSNNYLFQKTPNLFISWNKKKSLKVMEPIRLIVLSHGQWWARNMIVMYLDLWVWILSCVM
jgi:hypothetical protein